MHLCKGLTIFCRKAPFNSFLLFVYLKREWIKGKWWQIKLKIGKFSIKLWVRFNCFQLKPWKTEEKRRTFVDFGLNKNLKCIFLFNENPLNALFYTWYIIVLCVNIDNESIAKKLPFIATSFTLREVVRCLFLTLYFCRHIVKGSILNVQH